MTNLKTELLMVRHISKPKFFYLDPQIFVLIVAFSNVCGVPFKELVV